MNRSASLEASMRVLVRVRPPDTDSSDTSNSSSNLSSSSLVVDETEKKISLLRDKNKGTAEFSFSHVLNLNSRQNDLFLLCRDLINDVTDGINCSILAYGQTGSGKTYSMLGRGWEDISPNDAQQSDRIIQEHEGFGLIPRCIAELFEWIKKRSSDESFDYSINCQYIQIYNEKIFDLLQDRKRQNPLQIRDSDRGSNSSNCSVYVQGLSQYHVHSLDDVLLLLSNGMRNRAIRATELNNESSRSHTILQLSIQLHGQDSSGFSTLTRSTLSFVDLAGSEKWRPALSSVPSVSVASGGGGGTGGAAGGSITTAAAAAADQQITIREMTNINTSLHVLGNCVSALIESGRKHIPFRDSILTRLLQDSLGGGKTTLLATVRSDELMRDETYSTLQFASRASKIKTILRPLSRQLGTGIGTGVGGEGGMTLEQAKKEIAMLRARVHSLESQSQQQQQGKQQQQLQQQRASLSDWRRIVIPHPPPHASLGPRATTSLDQDKDKVKDDRAERGEEQREGLEISLCDSCEGCLALEKALQRYISLSDLSQSLSQSLPKPLSDGEESVGAWGYSSTEEDLRHSHRRDLRADSGCVDGSGYREEEGDGEEDGESASEDEQEQEVLETEQEQQESTSTNTSLMKKKKSPYHSILKSSLRSSTGHHSSSSSAAALVYGTSTSSGNGNGNAKKKKLKKKKETPSVEATAGSVSAKPRQPPHSQPQSQQQQLAAQQKSSLKSKDSPQNLREGFPTAVATAAAAAVSEDRRAPFSSSLSSSSGAPVIRSPAIASVASPPPAVVATSTLALTSYPLERSAISHQSPPPPAAVTAAPVPVPLWKSQSQSQSQSNTGAATATSPHFFFSPLTTTAAAPSPSVAAPSATGSTSFSRPFPTPLSASVSAPAPAGDGSCQKHGLQACVLCSMFSSFSSSPSPALAPTPASAAASVLSAPNRSVLSSFPSSSNSSVPSPSSVSASAASLLQRPFPYPFPSSSISSTSGPSSAVLCPIHFVTNCLLCSLSKSSSLALAPLPSHSSSSTSFLSAHSSAYTPSPSPGQHPSASSSASSSQLYPSASRHLPLPTYPLYSLPKPSLSVDQASSLQPLTQQQPQPLQAMAFSSPSLPTLRPPSWQPLPSSVSASVSLSDQQLQLQQQQGQQDSRQQPQPPYSSAASASSSAVPAAAFWSSLSSADSAFGFTVSSPSQSHPSPHSQSHPQGHSQSHPSPSSAVATASSRPLSHHRSRPPQRQHTPPPSSMSSAQEGASPSSSSHTPIHPPVEPYQHLKKGIVFEDESDDIISSYGSTGAGAGTGTGNRRIDHRRAASHGFHNQSHSQSQSQGNQQEEQQQIQQQQQQQREEERRRKGREGGGPQTKSSNSSSKKLMKLPNGALVKRR